MKILIVDDHPLIREALRHVLTVLDADIKLIEAQNFADGLAAVADHADLDLILLDLGLPDMDGIETTRKTTSSHLLLNALRLVLAGGVYLPFEVLRQHEGTPEPALRLAAAAGQGGKMLTPHALGLTSRQADVLALMVQGKSNKLICRDLDIAEGTVKIHVTAILKSLNVLNRTQAVIAVGKLGLQFPPP